MSYFSLSSSCACHTFSTVMLRSTRDFVQQVSLSLVHKPYRLTNLLTALLLYDFLLTFPLETSQIWRGNVNVMKVLFVLNRYASFVALYGIVALSLYDPATNTVLNDFC